jgi:hypothetical protein
MEISVAMAVGFVFGGIWSRTVDHLRSVWMADHEADDFTAPPVARVPHPTNQIEPFWPVYD